MFINYVNLACKSFPKVWRFFKTFNLNANNLVFFGLCNDSLALSLRLKETSSTLINSFNRSIFLYNITLLLILFDLLFNQVQKVYYYRNHFCLCSRKLVVYIRDSSGKSPQFFSVKDVTK